MERAHLQRYLEEADSRIQRGQRNVDHQRKAVSDLEGKNRDATIAKALLRMFEKALTVHVADRNRLLEERQLSSTSMANRTFNIPKSKGKSFKTLDAIDVAAKYFVYKLYEATDRRPMQWQVLLGLGESAATISRAVEHGWVILQNVQGTPLDRKAALTDEGRRLARKGR